MRTLVYPREIPRRPLQQTNLFQRLSTARHDVRIGASAAPGGRALPTGRTEERISPFDAGDDGALSLPVGACAGAETS